MDCVRYKKHGEIIREGDRQCYSREWEKNVVAKCHKIGADEIEVIRPSYDCWDDFTHLIYKVCDDGLKLTDKFTEVDLESRSLVKGGIVL